MFSFRNVSKFFRRDFWAPKFFALDELSFDFPEHSITGLLGANGSGKTTMIKILLQFVRPSSGEVNYSQHLGGNFLNAQRLIGHFPERPYFYPHLTGQEFILFLGQLNEMNRPDIQTESKKWAQRLKIDHALNNKVRTYSKGMLQRLGMLTAIIHRPKLLILDEPLSGLDPLGRKEFKDIFMEIYADGTSIFFSSHIVSDIEEVADHLIIIEKGKLNYSGKMDSFLNSGQNNLFEISLEDKGIDLAGSDLVINQKNRLGAISVEVDFLKKDEFIQKNLEIGQNIIGLKPSGQALEEIVYQQRDQE